MEQPTVFTVDVTESAVRISGELDMLTAPAMIEAVLEASAVDLDLSEVTFMDSTGVNALLHLREARAALRIVAVSPRVQRVLDITSMSDRLLSVSRPGADA